MLKANKIKKQNIKFCIGIPAYNTSLQLLEKCLNSIINQSYLNFIVIFIDDHSKTDLCSIANKIVKKDKRFTFSKNEINLGATETRKRIIDMADGDYFLWIDSDDWVDFDYLQKCYNFINNHSLHHKKVLLINNSFLHNQTNKIYKLYGYRKRGMMDKEKAVNYILSDRYIKSYPWTFVVPVFSLKNISFEKANIHKRKIIDDLAVSYQYAENCDKACFSNICSYHHIYGVENSDSNTGDLNQRIINTYQFLADNNNHLFSQGAREVNVWNILYNKTLIEKKNSLTQKEWKNNIKRKYGSEISKARLSYGCLKQVKFRFFFILFLLKHNKFLFCYLLWKR